MSRLITQQTFDDAVKENIEEFSMTATEATESAIQEFESQVIITIGATVLLNDIFYTNEMIFIGCEFAKHNHQCVANQRSGNRKGENQ